MNKRDYFIKAINAGAGKKRAWVNSVFSVVVGMAPGAKNTRFWYMTRIVDGRMEFLDPDHDMIVHADPNLGGAGPEQPAWTPIDDFTPGQALFQWKEELVLQVGEIANYAGSGALITTYGNVFVNYMILVLPFGTTLPYMEGYISLKAIEAQIIDRMIDDPIEDPEMAGFGEFRLRTLPPERYPKAPDGKIYVRQYLHFCDNALSLMAYATSIVSSASKKSMVPHPDRTKVRDAEVGKYTPEELKDPAIVARIGNVMEDLDREHMKGDPAEQFYKSNDSKFFGGTRKRMFYMFGGESPFEDGTSVDFIQKSLEEGIDPDYMAAMNNSTRFGSYNRGAQTKLGGESTKTIYRMLGTVRIAEPDCGVKLGVPTLVTKASTKSIVGFTIVDGEAQVLLTPENVGSYVGRFVNLRGPGVCKSPGKNPCGVCAGRALSEQPNGLAAAAAGLGGRFLTLFLKKMHASALKTARWDWKRLLK
jgi:hypothetical protein